MSFSDNSYYFTKISNNNELKKIKRYFRVRLTLFLTISTDLQFPSLTILIKEHTEEPCLQRNRTITQTPTIEIGKEWCHPPQNQTTHNICPA